jgi:hypothetical protein
MSKIILPGTLVGLLATFEPCFHAPSYRTFQWLVAGWIHCLGGSGRGVGWRGALPMSGTRGFARPVLFRLYVGARRGGTKDAPGRPRRGTRQQAAQSSRGPVITQAASIRPPGGRP